MMKMIGASPRNAWQASPGLVDFRRRRRTPKPVELPCMPQRLVIDLDRAALVIVDMQNDFCDPEGWLASIGVDVTPAQAPIAPLTNLLPILRGMGVPVVWLNWGNRADRANLPPGIIHVYDPDGDHVGLGDPLPRNGSHVLQRGSWGAAIVDGLEVAPSDLRVDKYRMSGFFDTELDGVLRNLDVTTLLFAGVNVDQCVLATLIDAACLGYDCVLLEDCAATTSPAFCRDATIYNIRQCFGFVAAGADFAAAMAGVEPEPAEETA